MKKVINKKAASFLMICLLVQNISPVFAQAQKNVVSLKAKQGESWITVNGKSFTLKAPVKIKEGVHIIRLKKDLFTSVGINYSEWDKEGAVFVGLKVAGKQVILEIKRGQREIRVQIQGQYIELTPEPYLEGPNVFVPLEPLYELLGFSTGTAPAKFVEKQKPEFIEKNPVLKPQLLLETAAVPKTSPKTAIPLQPASGKVKKLPKGGNVPITLDKGTEAKIGEILYIVRDNVLIAKIRVTKAGQGWCVGKIISEERGETVLTGDEISVKAPEIVSLPEKEKTPTITETPVKEEKKTETKMEEKITKIPETPPVTKEQEISKVPGKMRVAVLDFENISDFKDENLSKKLSDNFLVELVKTQKYELVEREYLEKIMKEKGLSVSGFVDMKDAKEIGSLLEADAVITGRILSVVHDAKEKQVKIEVFVRMIDVVTGKILYAFKVPAQSFKKPGYTGLFTPLLNETIGKCAENFVLAMEKGEKFLSEEEKKLTAKPKKKSGMTMILAVVGGLGLAALAMGGGGGKDNPPPPPAGTGSIDLMSSDPNAKVYLDGVDTGNVTPALLTGVSEGTHTIKLEKAGFNAKEFSVTVTKDQTTVVSSTQATFNVTDTVSEPEVPFKQ